MVQWARDRSSSFDTEQPGGVRRVPRTHDSAAACHGHICARRFPLPLAQCRLPGAGGPLVDPHTGRLGGRCPWTGRLCRRGGTGRVASAHPRRRPGGGRPGIGGTGGPGALASAAVWGLVVWSVVRTWRRAAGSARILAAGWLAALTAYLVQVQFSFSVVALAPIVWLLAGSAAGWEAEIGDGR